MFHCYPQCKDYVFVVSYVVDSFGSITSKNDIKIVCSMKDCCLTSSEQNYSHIITRARFIDGF